MLERTNGLGDRGSSASLFLGGIVTVRKMRYAQSRIVLYATRTDYGTIHSRALIGKTSLPLSHSVLPHLVDQTPGHAQLPSHIPPPSPLILF